MRIIEEPLTDGGSEITVQQALQRIRRLQRLQKRFILHPELKENYDENQIALAILQLYQFVEQKKREFQEAYQSFYLP